MLIIRRRSGPLAARIFVFQLLIFNSGINTTWSIKFKIIINNLGLYSALKSIHRIQRHCWLQFTTVWMSGSVAMLFKGVQSVTGCNECACIRCYLWLIAQASSSAPYSCLTYQLWSAIAQDPQLMRHTLWLHTMLCSTWKLWHAKSSNSVLQSQLLLKTHCGGVLSTVGHILHGSLLLLSCCMLWCWSLTRVYNLLMVCNQIMFIIAYSDNYPCRW